MKKKEISGKVKINNASFNGIVNAASVDLKSSIVNNDNINACIAERGVAGFSPVANVIKNGDDVTITITDYKGTTTATIPDMSDEVERIESLIPNTASLTNKLVDSATLNSSVQTATSNFRGDWATYADIPIDVSLYPIDAAGVRTPSTNDYLVVITDEEKNGGTWRYKYVGLWAVDGKNGWQAEYQVNETPFTASQLAAINSGITAELVEEIGQGEGNINDKITNCLLEVPQNIKVELSDSGLTLKAGSIITFPNGANNFEHYTVPSDITLPSYGGASTDFFIGLRENKTSLYAYVVHQATSGTTAPTGEGLWYDTTNNLVKFYNSSNELQWTGLSFPFVICSRSSGTITSIKQVFNGFGYMGSTIWADKGIKGLIPNGRNEDGTLKNTEFTTNKVMTSSYTATLENRHLVLSSTFFGGYINNIYNEDKNINVAGDGAIQQVANVGSMAVKNGAISFFQTKQPFRAVDYNEFDESINILSKAYITETYVNGTSWYRVWSDGWKEQGGQLALNANTWATVTFLKTFADANYSITALAQGANTSLPDVFVGWKTGTKTSASIQLGGRYLSTNGAIEISWEARGY